MKIRNKIILSNILIVNIIVIISLVFYFSGVRAEFDKDICKKNKLQADMLSLKLDEFLTEHKALVDQTIHTIVHFNITDYDQATDFLENLHTKNPQGVFALFYDTGVFINCQAWVPPKDYNPRKRPWYKRAKQTKETIITEPYLSESSRRSKMAFSIIKQFKTKDNISGVLVTEIYFDSIEKIIQDIAISDDASVILLDKDLTVLLHPNKKYQLGINNFINIKSTPNGNEIYKKIIDWQKSNKKTIVLKDYDNVEKFFYFSKSELSDWVVAYTVPLNKFNPEITMIRMKAIGAGFLCFVIIAIISYILAKKFASPIEEIKASIEKAMQVKQPINSSNFKYSNYELRQVVSNFNSLVKKNNIDEDIQLGINEGADKISNKLSEIKDIQNSKEEVYLLYVDIDKFKTINRLFGFYAGNELIEFVYKNIEDEITKENLKNHKFVYLLNDEFTIFYYGTKESACYFANKIIQKVAYSSFICNEKKMIVCISVGITSINEVDADTNQILVSAYEASALACASGGNCYKFVSNLQDIEFNTKNIEFWLTSIQTALSDNNFVLYKQEIKPLKDNVPYPKYEILIRLKTKDGKIIAPDNFIPIAEHYNMIYEIDKWVIDKVFAHYAMLETIDSPEKDAMFSINISADSFFSNDLIEYIEKTRKKYNIPADHFCFELTESCAARNLEATQKFVVELRQKGFLFALDDFGKGYSSFPYLKSLPIDYVKIDGSFVKSIDKDYIDFSLVKTMRDMCHHLGLYTVAEYAENEEIVSILKNIGVDYGQGYAFQKPEPLLPPPPPAEE